VRSFIICIVQQILSGDQIKQDEISETCSRYGRVEKYMHNFSCKNLSGRSRHSLEYIKLKLKEIGCGLNKSCSGKRSNG